MGQKDMENKTKGIKRMPDDEVGEKILEQDDLIVERELNGKFSLYSDYSKLDKSKFKRLTR